MSSTLLERGHEVLRCLSRTLPKTPNEALTLYVPSVGAASYTLFSMNIMEQYSFRRFVSPNQLLVANVLWLNAHVGLGYYIYTRRHLAACAVPRRVAYSVMGSVTFNFGSVLLWASLKSLLPDSAALRVIVALGSGVGLLYLGRDYLRHVDSHTVSPAPGADGDGEGEGVVEGKGVGDAGTLKE